jgi:hypothetical protein
MPPRLRLALLTLLPSSCLLVSLLLYRSLFTDLPSLSRLTAALTVPSTRILARDGRLLYQITDPFIREAPGFKEVVGE